VTKAFVLSVGGAVFFGCGKTDGTASDGSGSRDAGSTDAGSTSAVGSAETWARGGTAAMTDKASYPDPFAVASTQCVLLAAATEGPCTESADQVRQDISEGYSGLPMRLAFRVVDTACKPVANAKVKVWHTELAGGYSGDTPNNGMCLKSQADEAKHFFRGVQPTDADGRVYFDSCFPGWYRGRTVHVHYTVTAFGKSFTSQVVFDQSLVNEIFSTHPEYVGFGLPDTTNAKDNVVGNANLDSYVAKAERMSDGAMLASKELVVFTA
jgi:protocatechuate 3,4-dioxygenase beta subunit